MAKFIIPLQIEANSRKEAEDKVLEMVRIVAEHKKFFMTEVVADIAKECVKATVLYLGLIIADKKQKSELESESEFSYKPRKT